MHDTRSASPPFQRDTTECGIDLLGGLRALSSVMPAARVEGAVPETILRLERLLREGAAGAAVELCRAQRVPGSGLLPSALLTAVIRRFEAAWMKDDIGFGDLSMVFLTLHRVLVQLLGSEPATGDAPGRGRVLVATVPGEEHVFGAMVLADALRALGWHVDTLLGADAQTLCARVGQGRHTVVGLSVGHDLAMDGLADLIADLRTAAHGPAPRILIGGAALVQPVDQYHFLGADGIARSAADAARWMAANSQQPGPT